MRTSGWSVFFARSEQKIRSPVTLEPQSAMKWIKRFFGKKPDSVPHADGESEDRWWNARMAALHAVLGPSEDMVFHALQPLYLGGFADVVEFRQHVPGSTYVTSDLIGESGQLPSSLGNYELMICTREKSDWAANIICKLAKYTLEAVLEPGQTMDIGPAAPKGSTVAAFLFAEPEIKTPRLTVNGLESGLLLCVGILPDELAVCMKEGSTRILELLKDKKVFPYTDLNRTSVLKEE